MQAKKQELELDMEQWTGFKLGKEYIKAVYCLPAYLTSMQSTSCEMPGWMKHNLELRLLGKMSITSDMEMTPLLWQKQRGTKEPFDKSEKAGLNLNIQKAKFMSSGPITSWQIDGEIVETGQTLYTLAPKSLQMMTAAMKLKDTCSLKESCDQPRQNIKHQRYYFADKGPSNQSYGFSSNHVWM